MVRNRYPLPELAKILKKGNKKWEVSFWAYAGVLDLESGNWTPSERRAANEAGRITAQQESLIAMLQNDLDFKTNDAPLKDTMRDPAATSRAASTLKLSGNSVTCTVSGLLCTG